MLDQLNSTCAQWFVRWVMAMVLNGFLSSYKNCSIDSSVFFSYHHRPCPTTGALSLSVLLLIIIFCSITIIKVILLEEKTKRTMKKIQKNTII